MSILTTSSINSVAHMCKDSGERLQITEATHTVLCHSLMRAPHATDTPHRVCLVLTAALSHSPMDSLMTGVTEPGGNVACVKSQWG